MLKLFYENKNAIPFEPLFEFLLGFWESLYDACRIFGPVPVLPMAGVLAPTIAGVFSVAVRATELERLPAAFFLAGFWPAFFFFEVYCPPAALSRLRALWTAVPSLIAVIFSRAAAVFAVFFAAIFLAFVMTSSYQVVAHGPARVARSHTLFHKNKDSVNRFYKYLSTLIIKK